MSETLIVEFEGEESEEENRDENKEDGAENKEEKIESKNINSRLSILSYNINSFKSFLTKITKIRQTLEKWFEFQDCDIICFQETRIMDKDLPEVKGYTAYINSNKYKYHYSGVAVYVKSCYKPLKVEYVLENNNVNDKESGDCKDDNYTDNYTDKDGRVIILHYSNFTIINVYVPNPGKLYERLEVLLKFLRALQTKCIELIKEGKNVIVVGDINVAHTELDTHNIYSKIARPVKGCRFLTDLLTGEQSLLVDTYRYINPYAQKFTCWYNKKDLRDKNIGWRLDYALISRSLLERLVTSEIIDNEKSSDHCPILLVLDFDLDL